MVDKKVETETNILGVEGNRGVNVMKGGDSGCEGEKSSKKYLEVENFFAYLCNPN
jgi:hypothetical protein